MAITFNPSTSNPNSLPPKGTYYATIDKAEMKTPKDASKADYLSYALTLVDRDGKNVGKIYDNMFDSSHEVVRYKINRFIVALELPMTEGSSFELKDIAKIINGKRLIVDITHDIKSEPHKAVVDVFKKEVYYPLAQAAEIFDLTVSEPLQSINASDAVDAVAPVTSEDY